MISEHITLELYVYVTSVGGNTNMKNPNCIIYAVLFINIKP